jgi:hypothetical protein
VQGSLGHWFESGWSDTAFWILVTKPSEFEIFSILNVAWSWARFGLKIYIVWRQQSMSFANAVNTHNQIDKNCNHLKLAMLC